MRAQAGVSGSVAFRLTGVTVAHQQGRPVLDIPSLAIAAGRWTAVVGPNGAGKSTLLLALAALRPFGGSIEWGGRPLAACTPRERARQLAWLGALPDSVNDMTAAQVVALGRWPHQTWWGAPTPQDASAIERAMRETDCWPMRQRPMGTLSAGERQRVWLARTLATEAQVLLLDEPLAHLDPPQQALFLSRVTAWLAEGRTVVTVLHELSAALRAQDLVLLSHGRLVHQGLATDPITHRAVETLFDHTLSIQMLQGHAVPILRG